MCALCSAALPFLSLPLPACFYLPLASTLAPSSGLGLPLVHILCVVSSLTARGGTPFCRTPIFNANRNSCVCAFCTNNARTAWDVEGCGGLWRVVCRPRLGYKNWNFLEMKNILKLGNHTIQPYVWPLFVTCWPVFSHLQVPRSLSPVFPRGPCVPPRPHIRHTHKYTHMVLITQTDESGEWGIRWKQNTVGHSCQ